MIYSLRGKLIHVGKIPLSSSAAEWAIFAVPPEPPSMHCLLKGQR